MDEETRKTGHTGEPGAQPTVEGSRPEGGGIFSDSGDGGNKRDRVSSGPNLGPTIAGRDGDGNAVEREHQQ
jgi:hypothetical protein